MKEELINFKTARLAKEKGFILTIENEPILEIYDNKKLEYDSDGYTPSNSNIIYAPTQSLLQKWLREKHNLEAYPYLYNDGKQGVWKCYVYKFDFSKNFGKVQGYPIVQYNVTESGENGGKPLNFKSYEEALEAGLMRGLKLIK